MATTVARVWGAEQAAIQAAMSHRVVNLVKETLMFRIKTLTWSVVCALSATGCATFSQPANAPQWRIETSVGVRGSSPAPASREAVQMDPSHVDARNGLAIVFSAVGRHDEAVRELQAALALAPHLGY